MSTLVTITVPTATAQVKFELQGIPAEFTALGPLDVPSPLLYYFQPLAPLPGQPVVAEGFVLGNDSITISDIASSTYYLVTVFDPVADDTIYSQGFYFIYGNTFDLDTAISLSQGSIPTPPQFATIPYVDAGDAATLAAATALPTKGVGANTQLQFNDNGLIAGVVGATWDKVNSLLLIGNSTQAAMDPNFAPQGSLLTILNNCGSNNGAQPSGYPGGYGTTSWSQSTNPSTNNVSVVGLYGIGEVIKTTSGTFGSVNIGPQGAQLIGISSPAAGATIECAKGVEAGGFHNGAGTTAIIMAIDALSPSIVGGSVGSVFGVHVRSQVGGTANYGLEIDGSYSGSNDFAIGVNSTTARSFFGVINFGATALVPDTGISRIGVASLAIGNGVAGDVSGSLTTGGGYIGTPQASLDPSIRGDLGVLTIAVSPSTGVFLPGISISSQGDGTTQRIGIFSNALVDIASSNGHFHTGGLFEINANTNVGTISQRICGAIFSAGQTGTGTVVGLVGLEVFGPSVAVGAVCQAAVMLNLDTNFGTFSGNGGADPDALYGIQVNSPSSNFRGTTYYGITVGFGVTAATTNYGIYMDNSGFTGVNDYGLYIQSARTFLGGNTFIAGVATSVVTKTSSYVATATDHTINCNGTFPLTLPTTGLYIGQEFYIKNIGTGVITVSSSANIDSSTSLTLPTQYQSITIQWDGTQYWIY